MVMGRSLYHLQASLTTAIWHTTDELAVLFSLAGLPIEAPGRTGTSPEAHRVIVGARRESRFFGGHEEARLMNRAGEEVDGNKGTGVGDGLTRRMDVIVIRDSRKSIKRSGST